MSSLIESMRRPAFQRGVGMVELMVAMMLGALVVIGVVQVFSANRQTFKTQDGMALTQESGTFALDFIARDLMRAGYDSKAFALDPGNSLDNQAAWMAPSDRLAVIYDVAASNRTYCTGDATPASGLISNRYWVNNLGQLLCQGFEVTDDDPLTLVAATAAQVLVDNVESFQVLYGVDLAHPRDQDAGGGCPDSPAAPTAFVTAATLPAAYAWANVPPDACRRAMPPTEVVRSVRLGMLIRTQDPVGVAVPAARTYTVLDTVLGAPAIQPNDGRLRRLFTKTVKLRNAKERI